jgi:thiol-disulfide isomerase/thioredoxin
VTTGLVVLITAVVVALGFGAFRAVSDGRFRARRADEPAPVSVLDGTAYDDQRGERATLLQFSSAFCAPCRATRRVLSEVAEVVPGVRHIEVDAEHHLELVRALGVVRTPTTLVLDGAGREVTRAAGAPSKQAVLTSLGAAVSE